MVLDILHADQMSQNMSLGSRFLGFALLALVTMSELTGASLLEDGEDFSNNLISDLAPLLALFGGRVTEEFMSQSTGWADYILLAVAPLGVITITVSAIRVGGYPWLKAVIGRGRENIVAAELEVMSSTSREACEMWNGSTLVKCPGMTDTCEFICIYPRSILDSRSRQEILPVTLMDMKQARLPQNQESQTTQANENITKLDETVSQNEIPGESKPQQYYLRKRSSKFERAQEFLHPLWRTWAQMLPSSMGTQKQDSYRPPAVDLESAICNGNQLTDSLESIRVGSRKFAGDPVLNNNSPSRSLSVPEKEIIIIRNSKNPAPNISLNCQADLHRWQLWLFAGFGVILQGGVLTYFGLVTEHEALSFENDGQPIDSYAMPLSITGTVLLVVGLTICAYVVDSGSEETVYEVDAAQGEATVAPIWLQKERTISDQHFPSAAIYPTHKCYAALTSTRAIDPEGRSTNDETSSNDVRETEKVQATGTEGLSQQLKLLTLAGTLISVSGIVGQFTGLRGLHWTASIAQLGAVVFMTILRALVRRHLFQSIKHTTLPSGYELEWFVMTVANLNDCNPSWLPENVSIQQTETKPARRYSWSLETETSAFRDTAIRVQLDETRNGCRIENPRTPQGILNLRRYLGELGKWDSTTRDQAIAVSEAMEATMTFFESHIKDCIFGNTFTWVISVGGRSVTGTQLVEFHMRKDLNGWKARLDEVDAALSLWLYSVTAMQEEAPRSSKLKQPSSSEFPSKNDNWIRGKGLEDRCLQILGTSGEDLIRDLNLWMPSGLDQILEVEEADENPKDGVDDALFLHKIQSERIGHSGGRSQDFTISFSRDPGISTMWKRRNLNLDEPSKWKPRHRWLAVESRDSLMNFYAREMFSSFVWALCSRAKPFAISETLEASIESPDNANLPATFTLRNPKLSRLVETIAGAGFWSERDVYLSLIPPLSSYKNLPGARVVTELAVKMGLEAEANQNLSRAGRVYEWLWETACKFPMHTQVYWRTVAIITRFSVRINTLGVKYLPYIYDGSYDLVDHKTLRGLWMVSLRRSDCHAFDVRKILSEAFGIYNITALAFSKDEMECIRSWWSGKWNIYTTQAKMPRVSVSGLAPEEYERDIFGRTSLHHAVGSYLIPEMYPTDLYLSSDSGFYIDSAREHCRETLKEHQKTVRVRIQKIRERRVDAINWEKPSSDVVAALIDPEIILLALLQLGRDPNARDLDHWTPLHYACHFVLPHGRPEDSPNSSSEGGPEEDTEDHPEENDTTLFYEERAVWRARILLLFDADVNSEGLDGATPLHCAARSGCEELFDLLIKHKANMTRDKNGRTLLHLAAMAKRTGVLTWLLKESRTEPENQLSNGEQQKDRSAEDHLDITAKDRYGCTPLHLAAAADSPASIKKLIEHGSIITARDAAGRTPLHLAAMNGASRSIVELIKQVANRDETDETDDEERTPLHIASLYNQPKAINTLLGVNGGQEPHLPVDINAQDAAGRTPLHLAAFFDSVDAIKALIAVHDTNQIKQTSIAGTAIDFRLEDEKGCMPLHAAASSNSVGAVKLLMEHTSKAREGPFLMEHTSIAKECQGPSLLANNDGETPFHFAAYYGNVEVFEEMLRLMEDLSLDRSTLLCVMKGGSALHGAIDGKRLSIVHVIFDAVLEYDRSGGTNMKDQLLKDRDRFGRTAACCAFQSLSSDDEREIALYLIEQGAKLDFVDNGASNALHLAAMGKAYTLAKAVFDKVGLERSEEMLNKRDNGDRTPQMIADEEGGEIAKLFSEFSDRVKRKDQA